MPHGIAIPKSVAQHFSVGAKEMPDEMIQALQSRLADLRQSFIFGESDGAEIKQIVNALAEFGSKGHKVRYQSGGKVPGYGGGDKIPALLEAGEYVVRKEVASKYTPFLESINAGGIRRYAQGGQVTPIYASGGADIRDIFDVRYSTAGMTDAQAIQEQNRRALEASTKYLTDFTTQAVTI
jgi:hypothetical protein